MAAAATLFHVGFAATAVPSPSVAAAPALEFDRVYDDHVDFVWRAVRRLGLVDAAIDDAVQDVFIVVHRRLSSFEGRGSVRAWLYSITRRVVSDHRRRSRRKDRGTGGVDELRTEDASPEAAAAQAEARAALYQILAELSDDQREVFVLAELEQMRAPEIAEAIGANINTIYSRLRAARRQVNEAVERLQRPDRWESHD